MHPTMKMPARLYAERDPETNEKRWYGTRGMGDEYVRADEVAALIAAEREACAKVAEDFYRKSSFNSRVRSLGQDAAERIATAIRARNN